MIDDSSNSINIDPFISIFLDGKYKSIDLVPIKNKVIKFCSEQNINIKLESSPRLLAFWNRPKLVWRILHDQNRTCLLYTSPSPRDRTRSRMPSSA